MYHILNTLIRTYFKSRKKHLHSICNQSIEKQNFWFNYLLKNGTKTVYGKICQFDSFQNYSDFQQKVPIVNYETLQPWIQKMMDGEHHILWNSKITCFAKSSGTSSSKSKYLPVSKASLKYNHYKSTRDILTIYVNLYPQTQMFKGKGLALGGSFQNCPKPLRCGDVSAILMQNSPVLGDFLRTPSRKTALMANWKEKLKNLCRETQNENVTSISGVPSWLLILCQEVIKSKSAANLAEVWSNLEVFFHGGVNFEPYKLQYERLMNGKPLHFINTYNASEGFFGVQDQRDNDDLLLLTDNGIFYEFIKMSDFYAGQRHAIPLSEVELHTDYALVITTCCGLWRYVLGDTVKFTSLKPYRFKITGRTNAFINAFGEELVVENAEQALAETCTITQTQIREYTVAPIYFSEEQASGRHQWLIEFETPPQNLQHFESVLDQNLKKINSDYEAKRSYDLILKSPEIIHLPDGTFFKWLEKCQKLGGQHKIPRLKNDRSLADDILKLL